VMMPDIDYRVMKSNPIRPYYLPESVMGNLIRHIEFDMLAAEWEQLMLGQALEALGSGQRVLDMLAAMMAGSDQSREVSRRDDEFGALCWQELSKRFTDISDFVKTIAQVGAGPFASSVAGSFVQDIIRAVRLGDHDSQVEIPDGSGIPKVHVKTLRAELAPWPGVPDNDLSSGEVHLHMEQLDSGNWSTAIVYSQADLANSAVMANHYYLMPDELYHAVLMHDRVGDHWAYITRSWELPDGGNVMRVRASNAEQMVRFGMHSYPMKNVNPYNGFVLWDKSSILQGNPSLPMPDEGASEDESFDLLSGLLLLAQSSDMIEDADSWVRVVGQAMGASQPSQVLVPNLDLGYAELDLVVDTLADGTSLSEAGALVGLSDVEMVQWFNTVRTRDCVPVFKNLTIEAEFGRRLARTNGRRMSRLLDKRKMGTLSDSEIRELRLLQQGQGVMGDATVWEAALEHSRVMRQEIQSSAPSVVNTWYYWDGMW
jgi:hypothetical protein